jgi:hypothetical protein
MVQVGGEMKKSTLAKNPRRIAGKRLMKRFNRFPSESSASRHIAVTRFSNPEAARLALAVAEGTTVEGWFEFNEELMALYSYGDALVLFDRYIDKDVVLDTVISIASASVEDLERVMNILSRTTPPEWDDQLHLEFGND